jgi:hypothetical protein
MKLYVYDADTRVVVAVIEGDSNAACESVAADRFDDDQYLTTYTPAFGAADGLEWSDDAEKISA